MTVASRARVPDEIFARMVALRRDLHRHPELSGQERRTAERIGRCLDDLGIPHRRGVGGHGVVAELEGRASRAVLLRADMDALPIQEETGLEFASVQDWVMHACGHDGHAAMLVGAAELLQREGDLPAPVRLIWQPAEETGAGARSLIDAGVLDGAGMILGAHLDRHRPAGVLIVTEGSVNASTDTFTIDVQGRQGHGARPHEAVDTVVVGSLLVTALQTIVSREVDPAHPSVVSVGRFEAGTAPNVIAGKARLEGTIRAQSAAVREHLRGAVQRIAAAVGVLHGADVHLRLEAGTPPVVNTPPMAALAREAAVDVVGADRVEPMHTVNMGGEDFSWYLEHLRGAYIRVGARAAGREGFPAHSSQFDFDEQALATGAAWFARVAQRAGDVLGRDEDTGG